MTDVAANPKVSSTDYAHGISFGEAFVVWLRVAMLSFGGPAGQKIGRASCRERVCLYV